MDLPDDATLLDAVSRGDAVAFERLVRRWEGPLQRFLERLLHSSVVAEDARQLALLRVYTHAGQYRGGSVRSWIFQVAFTVGLNVRRAERRRVLAALADDDGPADDAAAPDARAADGEQRAAVHAALGRLEEDDRALLWLRVAEGLTFEETGRVLDTPPSTLRYRLVRALQRLRREMQTPLENGGTHAVP